jgi:hypothetical protein
MGNAMPINAGLLRRFCGLEANVRVTAVTEGFILRLAAAAEIERRELTFRVFFSRVIQNLCAARYFVRAILEGFYGYVSHILPPR